MSRDEWFRSPDWGAEAEAVFEARLTRARPRSRPQYRRIKALALLDTGDPGKRVAGQELLEHIVADPDAYQFEKVLALSLLGANEQETGQLEAAERHLRAALSLMATNMSGGTDLEEVRLAEILVDRGGRAELEEARDLIDRAGPSRPLFLSHRFRKCLVGVRIALALGDHLPAQNWARLALELASATHSGLANHPKLGLVETDDATTAWLAEVVASVGFPTSADPGVG
jgi:hypothetical protein